MNLQEALKNLAEALSTASAEAMKDEAYCLKAKSLLSWMDRVEGTWFHDPETCESYLDGDDNMFCVRQTDNGPEIHNVWRGSDGKTRQSANRDGMRRIEEFRNPDNFLRLEKGAKPPRLEDDSKDWGPGSIFLSLERYSDFFIMDARDVPIKKGKKK